MGIQHNRFRVHTLDSRLRGNERLNCKADHAVRAVRNQSSTPAFLTRHTFGRRPKRGIQMSILWLIIIGFIAGVIAKFLHPGANEPSGFIVTTLLGIAGAFVATYLGQALGWYRAGEGAGLIGAVVGAIIVLVVWGAIAGRQRTTLR